MFKVDQLLENLNGYLQTQFALIKLEAREELGKAVVRLAGGLAIALVGLLAIIFVSLALAVGLGTWWQMPWLGYLAVGLLYILALGLLLRMQQNGKLVRTLGLRVARLLQAEVPGPLAGPPSGPPPGQA
jgi:hypothetical protein